MQHLNGLNDAQREAVLATRGPISVLAGAGSGKTRVLTTRIYHLIKEGTPADRILAVTFTNKAAREMKERLAERLGDGSLPFVATFHGLGREILQRYGSRIGIPRYFTIFDRDDSKSAVKQVLKEMDIDPKELSPGFVLGRISKDIFRPRGEDERELTLPELFLALDNPPPKAKINDVLREHGVST